MSLGPQPEPHDEAGVVTRRAVWLPHVIHRQINGPVTGHYVQHASRQAVEQLFSENGDAQPDGSARRSIEAIYERPRHV